MNESPAYHVGEAITLAAYADDFEGAVTAVRFSLDEGEHWTTYPIDGATLPRGVSWSFTFTPSAPGLYLLRAQSMSGQRESSVLTTFAFEVLP